MVAEFGQKYALAEQLAVSLQFSQAAPDAKLRAAKALASPPIPIANLGLLKPSEVVAEVAAHIPHPMNLAVHTRAWRHYGVRPPRGDAHPERTRPEYCGYDEAHEDYVYTKAWADKLTRDLADPEEYQRVTGRAPLPRPAA